MNKFKLYTGDEAIWIIPSPGCRPIKIKLERIGVDKNGVYCAFVEDNESKIQEF